jgi:cytochrome b involved in lipid metabolism
LTVTTSSEKSYTLADISTHSTSTDCYMAISGKIYDVTKYINSHPGGDVIVEGCGKDATELFTEERKHAGRAESLLPEFEIGILKQS